MKFNEVDTNLIKNRMAAFWEHELYDAPLIAFTPMQKIAPTTPHHETPSDASYDELLARYSNTETILENAEQGIKNATYYGDTLPNYFPNFGAAGHAAYFGCRFRLKSNSIWFETMDFDPETDKLQFDKNSPVLLAQEKLFKLASKKAQGYTIGMPDNCGSLDALAHIRGTQELLMDLLLHPEFVKTSTMKIVDALTYSGDIFFEHSLNSEFGGSCNSWFNLWSPKRFMQLQCDFSTMISPEQFAEFVMPELEATIDWLDHSIYHLDGEEQIRHLDMLLSIEKLHGIQWTPVAGQPKTTHFIEVLKKIQAAGKSLVLMPEANEMQTIMDNLRPEGVRVMLQHCALDEGLDVIKHAKNWR